jgi:hypothetical protein
MTNAWRRGLVADALRAFGLSRHQSTEDPHEQQTVLSDEAAMAQVVDAARQIVRSSRLGDVTGAFRFESCNDQGEPPYRGRVDMSFVMPDGVEPDGFFGQIAATMVGQGWSAGPPPGRHPFGVVVHTETVMAIFGRACGTSTRGTAQVYGECRNMTDHCDDGMTTGVDVTVRLSGS